MDYVRCPECGERLAVPDRYGTDHARILRKDLKPEEEVRDWDPDWVLGRHLRRAH